jgi:hypothetical protein
MAVGIERGRKRKVRFRAYFDESGTHGDQAPLCVMAGFIGSERVWDKFNRLWTAIGEDAEDPGLHAVDLFGSDSKGQRGKPYRGWDDDRAMSLVSGVVNAVSAARVRPIVAALDVPAFLQYDEQERRGLTRGNDNPYFVVFEHVVLESLKLITRPDSEIDFIFDRNQAFESAARKVYDDLKAEGDRSSKRMGSIDFHSSHITPPLQAADLLAHCWYQLRFEASSKRLKVVKPVLERWTDKGYEGHVWSKEALDRALGYAPRKRGKDYEVRISDRGKYSITECPKA